MARTVLAFALAAVAWGRSGGDGTKLSENKKSIREKGYHYAHPKNTGPTPESAKESNSEKDAKRRKKPELDATTPPTRTPDVKPPAP